MSNENRNRDTDRCVGLRTQLELLRLEYAHEKKEYEKDVMLAGIGRKVRQGDCWYPVGVGRSYYNSLDRLVVEITRGQEVETEHNFEYGKTVSFFREDGSGGVHHFPFVAHVSYAEESRMVVELRDEGCLSELLGAEQLGVFLSFDETTYQLMFSALERVINAEEGRLWELKELFHGNGRLAEPLHILPIRLPWLNRDQERAVNRVVACRDVAVVHGPPGTGKTTTMIECVGEVLRRESQVLVCAQSNTAVDWIAEQLADRGYNVLRIGNPSRVTDKMLSFTYERRFEAHPDYPTLWGIRRSIRQLYQQHGKKHEANFHQKIERLKDKASELEIRIRNELFDQCRIVACTLAGSASPILTGQKYNTLFIDEAAQALEAACWIAMQKANRVILAGDHQQLPPTIKCEAALRGGLGRTLMEHIVSTKPQTVTMLVTQYRMSEPLMEFPSRWFYEGKLRADVSVRYRSIMNELDSPLVWVDSDNRIDQEDSADMAHEDAAYGGIGRINKSEAGLTLSVFKDYVNKVGIKRIKEENLDFGIISPYRAQVHYLRKIFKSDKDLKPLRSHVTINTVDSFQGQERDAIIISLVRANEMGHIGFLHDLRRMNVAMTRARMKLIIIGSVSTLCKHRFYRELYKHCKTRGHNQE